MKRKAFTLSLIQFLLFICHFLKRAEKGLSLLLGGVTLDLTQFVHVTVYHTKLKKVMRSLNIKKVTL